MIDIIKTVIATPSTKPETPEFKFDTSSPEALQESAEKNWMVLAKYGLDLEQALEAQKESPLGYGSEFKPSNILASIFARHPLWHRLKSILDNGSIWPLEELSDELRAADLQEAIEFGNHKGATKQPELLRKLVLKDVTHGYGLVIPLSKLPRLPGALMAPMNIQRQNTIDEHGCIVTKDRLTHDQSYKFKSGTSVNSRVKKDELQAVMFANAIKRICNWTVEARRLYPDKRILATKIDYKSAYRRCHIHAKTAIQACTQLTDEELAIVFLRLTFGGMPGSFEWGCISESICDLTNRLLLDEDWDPEQLHAPNQELVPAKQVLDDDIPFAEGKQLVVNVPVNPKGLLDVYIDDEIGITVDLPGSDNALRMARAPLLAIHAVSRPRHHDEPIPREELAALNKLIAEAGLEEIKTILGWVFNFRSLLISLPDNKFKAWTEAINEMIESRKATAKELECNIGRLVHLGAVISQVYHFMSRLRELQQRAKNRRHINIDEACIEDLRLMLFFLERAHEGVSLNLIAFRKPSHVYRSDSCPAGLGGYSHEGWAWRFYIPLELQFRASNNLLEHIACIVTVWIDIICGRLKKGDCCLSMTDSSTSEGWARKTNFKEDCEDPIQATVRIEVARDHAMRLLESGIKDYSQWFPGKENDVSDALSRDDDRSDEELTNILRTFVPSQMPEHFEIVQLPNEISSWLISTLQKLPVKEQLRERHTRTKLGRGGDGSLGVTQSDSRISSSTISPGINGSSSSELLPWLCVEGDFRDQLMIPWLKEQSEVPSHMWHRPSGKTIDPIQRETKTGSLANFYNDNSGRSETQTQTLSNRRPSPSEC